MPWYSARSGVRVARQRSSRVSCCSKNSPRSNSSMPLRSSGGAGSSQRARTGSSMAPPGTPLGGRAALRSRLVGGVRGPEELAAAEVVLDELADDGVVELLGELLKRLGKGDLDALVEVARRDEVALRDLVDARVLVVPDGPGLAECLADEADGL